MEMVENLLCTDKIDISGETGSYLVRRCRPNSAVFWLKRRDGVNVARGGLESFLRWFRRPSPPFLAQSLNAREQPRFSGRGPFPLRGRTVVLPFPGLRLKPGTFGSERPQTEESGRPPLGESLFSYGAGRCFNESRSPLHAAQPGVPRKRCQAAIRCNIPSMPVL